MFRNNFNASNAQFDQQNGNANAYGNAGTPHVNYNFDGSGTLNGSGPQPDMQVRNSHVANDTQGLLNKLDKAYDQLDKAFEMRQEAITQYHDLVVKHDAQVSALKVQHDAQVLALKDQIDILKDELRMARADAQTSRLPGTRYVMSY